jgi:ribonuclease HI
VYDGYVLDGLNLVKIDKDKNTKYILRFDGACRGNPSDELGLGSILYENGTKLDERSQKINVKSGTNNQAEYLALLSGLKMCLNNDIKNVLVQGDSELIIKQINEIYKVNNEKLLTYYNIAISLKLQFENISFEHIKR